MSMLPPPPPPIPAPPSGMAGSPTGGSLIASAWASLKQDRELIALPVLGGVVALLGALPLVLAAVVIGDNAGWATILLGAVTIFGGAIISTFFAVALAAGAHERMNGGSPTISSALTVAWSRKRGIIGWALLSTTVGLVLRSLEERLKGFGTILRFIGGVAWTLASYFAIPVIAANDCGAIEALKMSAATFKSRWSSAVRVQLRMGLYVLALIVAGFAAAAIVIALASVSVALAIIVGIALGGVWLVGVLLLSAVSSYARVVLYRYASGMSTPGFSVNMLNAAVTSKS